MGFTLVQSTGNNSTSGGTSFGVAYGSNVTAGNLLVWFADVWVPDTTQPTISVADSQGSGTADVVNWLAGTSIGNKVGWFHRIATASASDTVTASSNDAGSFIALAIFEFSFTGSLSVDGAGATAGNYVTGATSGSCGPLGASGDLVLCGSDAGSVSGGTFSTGTSGFSLGPNSTNSVSEPFVTIYNASVGGAVSPSITFPSSTLWNMAAVAYKLTAAASTLVRPPFPSIPAAYLGM